MTKESHKINDADEAFEIVLDAIVVQDLKPSQKVSEKILSEKYGISRAIARNLIERLIAKQYLVSVSQRITQVAPLTLLEIKQNFALRKMLLPEIISLSSAHADYRALYDLNDQICDLLPLKDDGSALKILKMNRKLNMMLCEKSGYPLMIDWVSQLEDMAMRIYWLYIKTKNSFPYSGEHQRVIFDVMKQDDTGRVHKVVLDILQQTEERMLNAIFSHEQFYTQDLKV